MFTDNCIYELVEIDKSFLNDANIYMNLVDARSEDAEFDDGIYRVILRHPLPNKYYVTFARGVNDNFADCNYIKWYLFNTQSRVYNIQIDNQMVVWAEYIDN